MFSRRLSVAFAVIATVAMISASGCAKKPKPEESTTPSTESPLDNTMGDSDSGKAAGLQTIHFAYDSFALDSADKSILKQNVTIMKSNPKMKIQIEGHTDARGGIQYNIALGEKRANSVKHYMTGLGINGERITTISMGKEHPLDPGTSDEAYAKNRRANFVVTSNK